LTPSSVVIAFIAIGFGFDNVDFRFG